MKKYIYLMFLFLGCAKQQPTPSWTAPTLRILKKDLATFQIAQSNTINTEDLIYMEDSVGNVQLSEDPQIETMTVESSCHEPAEAYVKTVRTFPHAKFVRIADTLPAEYFLTDKLPKPDPECTFNLTLENRDHVKKKYLVLSKTVLISANKAWLKFRGAWGAKHEAANEVELNYADLKDLKIFEPSNSAGTLTVACDQLSQTASVTSFEDLDLQNVMLLALQGPNHPLEKLKDIALTQNCQISTITNNLFSRVNFSKNIKLHFKLDLLQTAVIPHLQMNRIWQQHMSLFDLEIYNPYPFPVTAGISNQGLSLSYRMMKNLKNAFMALSIHNAPINILPAAGTTFTEGAGYYMFTLQPFSHTILNYSVDLKLLPEKYIVMWGIDTMSGIDYQFSKSMDTNMIYAFENKDDSGPVGYKIEFPGLKTGGSGRLTYFVPFMDGQQLNARLEDSLYFPVTP